jgi:hypothetical protein
VPLGEGAVGRTPGEAGERGVPGADRDGLPPPAPQLERPGLRGDGVAQPADEVEVDRHGLEQGGPGGVVVAGVAQRRPVEGDGLAVRSGACGLGRGGRRVPQHPGGVAGRGGVVGEHAGVAADRLEGVDHRRVQHRLGPGRGRLQHRGPGDLVPERDTAPPAVEEAGGREHLDRGRRHVERVQQVPVDRLGCAREQLEGAAGRRGQSGGAGEHGVPDALGQRGVRLGEDLADEEGVARGRRWTSAASSPCPSRSAATPDLLSGVSWSRRASGEATRSPRTGLSGWPAGSASR